MYLERDVTQGLYACREPLVSPLAHMFMAFRAGLQCNFFVNCELAPSAPRASLFVEIFVVLIPRLQGSTN